MYKVLGALTIVLVFFLVWISDQANEGRKNIFTELVSVTPYGDKIGHFVLFWILSVLAIGATRFKSFKLLSVKVYWAVAAISSYALADELLQYYSPNRTLDVYDLSANILGVLGAQLFCFRAEKYLTIR